MEGQVQAEGGLGRKWTPSSTPLTGEALLDNILSCLSITSLDHTPNGPEGVQHTQTTGRGHMHLPYQSLQTAVEYPHVYPKSASQLSRAHMQAAARACADRHSFPLPHTPDTYLCADVNLAFTLSPMQSDNGPTTCTATSATAFKSQLDVLQPSRFSHKKHLGCTSTVDARMAKLHMLLSPKSTARNY
jgi:hypothetical protein